MEEGCVKHHTKELTKVGLDLFIYLFTYIDASDIKNDYSANYWFLHVKNSDLEAFANKRNSLCFLLIASPF